MTWRRLSTWLTASWCSPLDPLEIQHVVEVKLPRPRVLSNPEILALKASILRELGVRRRSRAGNP